ncbi:MAG: sigma-70 family RNA polymerase sigma factor [Geminicoccaceae bacterium]
MQDGTDIIDPPPWQAFLERLRRYVAGRVPPASRDDVVGEIVLRLVQHREKLEASRNPFAWMTRVAANAVTDYHRRQASEQKAMTAYASDPSLSDRNMPVTADEGLPSADLAACVTPFIEQLPPRYRDALRLVEIEQLSQKEAAARLGISVSGMKSRVQRGRSKLKAAILRCCAIELDRRGDVIDYTPHTTRKDDRRCRC